jgi:hypothetical protein
MRFRNVTMIWALGAALTTTSGCSRTGMDWGLAEDLGSVGTGPQSPGAEPGTPNESDSGDRGVGGELEEDGGPSVDGDAGLGRSSFGRDGSAGGGYSPGSLGGDGADDGGGSGGGPPPK